MRFSKFTYPGQDSYRVDIMKEPVDLTNPGQVSKALIHLAYQQLFKKTVGATGDITSMAVEKLGGNAKFKELFERGDPLGLKKQVEGAK
jgi:hypothetical protein